MDEGSVVTCTACRERLVGGDARRLHYRSDLHRVNLKRKVGGLGPLTAEELSTRMAALEQEKNTRARAREARFCETCAKRFASERALINHEQSRRHLERARRVVAGGLEVSSVGTSDGVDIGEVGEVGELGELEMEAAVEAELARRLAAGNGFSMTTCVFDGHEASSVQECVKYMQSEFGFFVPFAEQLTNLEGLLRYLNQKVTIGYACVQCDRGFGDVGGVQRHMRDKGHWRMCGDLDEWMDEYAEFYAFEDGLSNDGWVEVEDGAASEVELLPAAEDEAVGLAVQGRVLGHRALHKYYRQGTGRVVDARPGVVANRAAGELRRLAFAKATPAREMVAAQRSQTRRQGRFELMVGGQNYYTRKACFKQSMAVFNSGYRA